MKSIKKVQLRTKIELSARQLFQSHGIRKVSIDEICSEAGTSKMTFYRNYSSKETLIEAVLDSILKESKDQYQKIMSETTSFPIKIEKILVMQFQQSKSLGSLFIKDIQELKNSTSLEVFTKYREEIQQQIIEDFRNAQQEGWINQDISIDFIMYMLNDIKNKAEDAQLLKIEGNLPKLIVQLTRFFFYGISAKGKE